MKKLTTIFAIILFAITFNNCGGGGGAGSGSGSGSSGSSNVTINVGSSSSASSVRGLHTISTADVTSIRFTISASDMSTITKTVSYSSGTTVSESFNVPNGNNRTFLVEALNSSGSVIYNGSTTANLNGSPVTLPITLALTSASGTVLIFGDYTDSRDILATSLTNLGYTVTNSSSLPADISSYGTIWHVSAYTALTSGEQSQLSDFLATGGGLYLTGGRPCCESLNASVQTLINSVVTGGEITVGGLGDIGGSYVFNSSALGSITTNPNTITTFNPSAPGGMGGLGSLPDSNILVTGVEDVPVGAVWNSSDLTGNTGRLVIIMDVNWFGSASPDNIISNIQTFLAGS